MVEIFKKLLWAFERPHEPLKTLMVELVVALVNFTFDGFHKKVLTTTQNVKTPSIPVESPKKAADIIDLTITLQSMP